MSSRPTALAGYVRNNPKPQDPPAIVPSQKELDDLHHCFDPVPPETLHADAPTREMFRQVPMLMQVSASSVARLAKDLDLLQDMRPCGELPLFLQAIGSEPVPLRQIRYEAGRVILSD